MHRMAIAAAVGALVVLTASSHRVKAGEIGGGMGNCDLSSSFLGCEWKSKDCYKPDKPFLMASDRNSYNDAVAEFNSYLTSIKEYEDCVIAEGKTDIGDRFPALVVKGAKQQIDDADEEAQSARTDLELSRSMLH
jgi:hypothetical protein